MTNTLCKVWFSELERPLLVSGLFLPYAGNIYDWLLLKTHVKCNHCIRNISSVNLISEMFTFFKILSNMLPSRKKKCFSNFEVLALCFLTRAISDLQYSPTWSGGRFLLLSYKGVVIVEKGSLMHKLETMGAFCTTLLKIHLHRTFVFFNITISHTLSCWLHL